MTSPYTPNSQPSYSSYGAQPNYDAQPYGLSNAFNQDGMPVRPAGHTAMVQVQQKSKMAAFLLCFFLGGFGANNFYMGQTGRGIAKLVLMVISIFSGLSIFGIVVALFLFAVLLTWDIIEMILILVGGADYGHDSHGVPLR